MDLNTEESRFVVKLFVPRVEVIGDVKDIRGGVLLMLNHNLFVCMY